MSTLYLVDEYEFFNRKPSKVQIHACLKNAIAQGSKAIAIIWGENQIELNYHDSHKKWYGDGWIKTIGGDDIAKELNKKTDTQKFMEEHFQLIRIGA